MLDQPLKGCRFLIVEDEMLIFLLIEGLMVDNGSTSVKIASCVEEAIVLIAGNDFDCATLDLNLNGTMSYPVADALHEHGVPFVFMTGYSTTLLPDTYSQRPVLRKPFDDAALIATLAELISQRPCK